ncbi:MAG: hypothetical protein Q9168_005128 [Polycauliona sp. 1 TL-2023]
MTQDATLSPLARADGSATFTCNGYSVIAAVNGPIEVQRRDEIPEESAIDVVLRPAIGVGGNVELFVSYTLDIDLVLQECAKDISNLSSKGRFDNGELVLDPPAKAVKQAASLHVLAFSSLGELLVAESEGTFDMNIWDQVYVNAEKRCRGPDTGKSARTDDVDMDPSGSNSLEDSLRSIVEEKAAKENRWKEN